MLITVTGPDAIPSAGSAARALRRPMGAHLSADTARARLARESLAFLTVVISPSGRLAGVVTADSLQPGPCCVRRAGRCSVVHHLDPTGAYCFTDEPLDEVLRTEVEIAEERGWPYRSAPLLVVDRELRPLGYLPCPAATIGAGSPLRAA